MKINILLFCMGFSMLTAMAQTNTDRLFNTTWKVNLEKATSHEFRCTAGKTTITQDSMVIIPQCYSWDYYFKIISFTGTNLVLEEYEYTQKKLIPTRKFYHLKRSNLTATDLDRLNYTERSHYLRIDSL